MRQSFDGGTTWHDAPGTTLVPPGLQAVTRHGLVAVAYPRLSGATAYARLAGRPTALLGAGAGGRMLFCSADEGIHWEPATMPQEPLGVITTLVPAAAARERAWAGTAQGALLRSDDRGRHWRLVLWLPVALHCLAAIAAPAG